MRDIDIRKHLHNNTLYQYHSDHNSIVIDELDLSQGMARIDIAVINGAIHGYEIKSEKDTLNRLPHQKDVYNLSLDYITLVTSELHIAKAKQIIPSFWGLISVKAGKDEPILKSIRTPRRNTSRNLYAVVQLLWKEEILEILNSFGMTKGIKSKTKRELWNKMIGFIEEEELSEAIRMKLKSRKNWRVVR